MKDLRNLYGMFLESSLWNGTKFQLRKLQTREW